MVLFEFEGRCFVTAIPGGHPCGAAAGAASKIAPGDFLWLSFPVATLRVVAEATTKIAPRNFCLSGGRG
jgi:hypothetical protein